MRLPEEENHVRTNKDKTVQILQERDPGGRESLPQLQKRQRPGGCLIAVIVVVVLVILLAVAGSGSTQDAAPQATAEPSQPAASSPSETDAASQEEQTETTYGVGDTVESDGVEVTLVSAEENTGADYITPADGSVFVALEFEIVNNSQQDISVSSLASFEAYCDDYSVSQSLTGATLYDDKGTLDSSVAAGKRLSGAIVYEVPADWQQLEVAFAPSVWVDRSVTFTVTNEG